MLRYVGMLLIFFSFGGFSFFYLRFCRRRLAEAEGYLSFLCALRRELLHAARPLALWLPDLTEPTLEANGFLPRLRAGEGMADAFYAATQSGDIGREERQVLSSLFSAFGRGYRAEEVRSLERGIEALGASVEAARRELPRRERVVRTLSASLSLSAVILLL